MDNTQLVKGVLDLAVLAVVADADGYGYDVVRRLRTAGPRCTSSARRHRQKTEAGTGKRPMPIMHRGSVHCRPLSGRSLAQGACRKGGRRAGASIPPPSRSCVPA